MQAGFLLVKIGPMIFQSLQCMGFTEKVKASASWVYYTGNAVTFPSGKYEVDGIVANYYTERNGYRMPDYHRLGYRSYLV